MNLLDAIIARARSDIRNNGKSALYDLHPELTERIPILSSESGTGGATHGSQAADFYSANVWVHKAIKVLKDNIAPLQLRVVEDDKEIKHELNDRLLLPNPTMDTSSLWSEWVINMMLYGEHGLEIVPSISGVQSTSRGKIAEMWPREAGDFYVRKGEGGKRYRRVAGYKIDDNEGAPYDLRPDQFIHFKFYNPMNIWRGLAPMSAVRMGVIIDQLAQAWARLFFRNQARPDFAVIAPQGVTKTEKDDMYLELDIRTRGGEGLHRPIILEQGITDIKTFSYPPKDMEWIAQRELSRDEIGAIFGVPDEIMGYGRDTYENFDTADRVLWTLTISPLVKMRDAVLTHFFKTIQKLMPSQSIETDLSGIPQLQEDRTEKVSQFDMLAQHGYPINALNEYFELGLPNVRGGDVGYLPLGLIPATSLNGKSSGIARLIEAGWMPVNSNSTPYPYKTAIVPTYGSSAHFALWSAKQARLNSPVKTLQRILKREFQRQQNEILRALRDSREFGRGKHKQDDLIPDPSSLFDLSLEARLFAEALRDDLTAAINSLSNAEMAALGTEVAFDIARPEVQAGIREILEAVSRKVNETTWLGLVDLFQEAEAAGEGTVAIQERLRAFFGERKSDWQTERIARTTMTGASGFGDVEAWDQSGVVKTKTWLSALIPKRTRDEHSAAHSQTVGIREAYIVGGELLMFPGDPQGSPGNIINCLCSQVPGLEEP